MEHYYSTGPLYHFGILGMKWGVRRFQNKDGTLTDAGKRRLSSNKKTSSYLTQNGSVKDSDRARYGVRTAVYEEAANDNRNLSSVLGGASSISSQVSTMRSKSLSKKKEKYKSTLDVSRMSDDDLRKAINRMDMENRYKTLSAEDIFSGRKTADDILEYAGTILAIGASAASIATAIYTIRK